MSGRFSTSAFAALIADCDDRDTALEIFAQLIEDCGACCAMLYSYEGGLESAADNWRPLYSTFSPEVSSFYAANRCVSDDPCIRASLGTYLPVRFLEVEKKLESSAAIERLYDLMRADGLRDGLVMHVSDRPGRLIYCVMAFDREIDDIVEFERRRIHSCVEMFVRHAGDLIDPQATRELSPKEQTIVSCLARGESNKQIARALGLSVSTVNTLVSRCFEKLGVKTRAEAAIAASRLGLALVA